MKLALVGVLAATAALALTGCASGGKNTVALAGAESSSMQMSAALAGSYQVLTLNDRRDLTFNQLLGINNEGAIAGYFGSGAAGHPNKGYVLRAPFAQRNFGNENFPGSVQTQVTGLNDSGVTVGFWSRQNTASMSNANFGFYSVNGSSSPSTSPLAPRQAAGGPAARRQRPRRRGRVLHQHNRHGARLHLQHPHEEVRPRARPGRAGLGPSLTAAAINNGGDVAGFYNKPRRRWTRSSSCTPDVSSRSPSPAPR